MYYDIYREYEALRKEVGAKEAAERVKSEYSMDEADFRRLLDEAEGDGSTAWEE